MDPAPVARPASNGKGEGKITWPAFRRIRHLAATYKRSTHWVRKRERLI